LGEFASRYPHVRLELVLDDGLANVVTERCDAGIRLGEHLLQDMVAVPVSPRLHMTVVGAPKYFLKHARPQTPDDLHNHNCIRFRKTSNGTIYRWELSDPGIPFCPIEFDPKGSFTTNDHDAMIRAAVQGVGLMQHISAAVEGYVQRGELIPVLEEWCQPFPGFYLYVPSRTMMPIKLRVFIDFLKEKML
jgi:DNA-binding transcriptional LysR family regulator